MSNTLLSPERVKEITERVERATAGPWVRDKFNDDIVWGPEHAHIADARGYGGGLPFKENADFIAASRTDIPDLLTERELLVGIVRKLGVTLHTIVKFGGGHGSEGYDATKEYGARDYALALLADPTVTALTYEPTKLKEQG